MSEKKEELKLEVVYKVLGVGVRCVCIVASGDAFAVAMGGFDPALIRSDSQRVESMFCGHRHVVTSIDEHPSGAYFATGCSDRKVRLFERTGSLVWAKSEHRDVVRCVQFSLDGALLASCSDDNTIRLWSVPGGAMVRQLNGHTNGVFAVAFSPDGHTLLTGSFD